MSLPRYIAILGWRDPFGVRRAIIEKAREQRGMTCVLAAPGLTLFSDAPAPLMLADTAGAILGPIFTIPPGARPMSAPGARESTAMVASCGDDLIAHCWGGYVAFLHDAAARRAMVIRAPFGELDCLHVAHRGVTVAASDLALLRDCCGLAPRHDWRAIAVHLATEGLRGSRTCVAGVEELLWGTRLVAGADGVAIEPCWSPWDFVDRSRRRRHPGEAADRLRAIALDCIGARTRALGQPLVMLSGGLDSSILATCVGATGARFACLNLTMGGTTGDERHYARMMAEVLEAPLLEAMLDPAHVDVTRSEAAHLPRPIARAFAQAIHRRKHEAIAAVGAKAVFNGGGGDNLFCSLQSVAPVADRLRVEGLGWGAWATACDMARLTETSVFTVAARAMRRAWLRSPAWRWPVDRRFLTPDALAQAGTPEHRWLAAPRKALPGSAAHIALLIAVENLLETMDGPLPELSPLMAQPLIEHCLGVPSWFWCRDGRNRMIARRAFANMLPDTIAWRRSKGAPDGFVAALFEANRRSLAELLADGLLAEHGLLDRDVLLATLADTRPLKGHDHVRLMKIADVETWARGV